VVLRAEAIRQRLLKLEQAISRLEEIGRTDLTALRTSFRDSWAAERGLQLAAEIVLDVGNHILSAHFGESARDYEDVITRLAACGVIDDRLRARLKGLGGFRNVLVHGYLDLDPDRVADYLAKAPSDFVEFMRAIRAWLGSVTK